MITQAINYAYSDGSTLLVKSEALRYARRFKLSWNETALAQPGVVRLASGYGLSTLLIHEARISLAMALRLRSKARWPLTAATPLPVASIASLSEGQGIGWGVLQAPAEGIEKAGWGMALLTGLPGSGKTYLISKLIADWKKQGLSVMCAAPTGKAASVLGMKVNVECTTIHRMLGLRPGQTWAPTQLEADVVVIDESSMLDVELLANLLDCCVNVPYIVLVGDPHQIPPVGAGRPFFDLVDQGVITNVHLTDIQRQGLDSGILEMSKDFLDGRLGDRYKNVHHFRVNEPAREAVELYCSGRLAGKFSLVDVRRGAYLLSPVKNVKYDTSTEVMNGHISHRLLPKRTLDKSKFTVGDRVMFTVNDYAHGFVNGELGVLDSYSHKCARITNDHGRTYIIDDYSLDKFAQWAYALTVHKAQGSEVDVVVLIVDESTKFMATKNLIYTAMTRAKQELVVVGDWDILRQASGKPEIRHTALLHLMADEELCQSIVDRHAAPNLSEYSNGY